MAGCPVQFGIQGEVWSACRTRNELEESHRSYRQKTDADDPGCLASGQEIRQPSAEVKNELSSGLIPNTCFAVDVDDWFL